MPRMILLTLLVLLCSSCTALSPNSQLTKLDLTLEASDHLNPDVDGRPSPLVVRLFELTHPVAFENADFFSLYERPREILSLDLVASEEHEVRPGSHRHLKLGASPGSRYVGVLAAYRDLPRTHWRLLVPLVSGQRTQATLRLEPDGIRPLQASAEEER